MIPTNELTLDRARELLDYDSDTGDFTRRVSVCGRGMAGKVTGTTTVHGYIRVGIDGRSYAAHRLAWLFVHGRWPEYQIDHVNGDRADNRLRNLREVTSRQNCQNLRCHREGRLPGAIRDRRLGIWKASIKVGGRRVHIGVFPNAEEASRAYLKACADLEAKGQAA